MENTEPKNIGEIDKWHPLSDLDTLKYHQLDTAYCWQKKLERGLDKESILDISENCSTSLPNKWKLLNNVSLHSWQEKCRDTWFGKDNNNCKGVAKVVTGAGKTILALSIAEKLQNELNPNLKLIIIVPTIVLLNQWYEVIEQHSNIPKQFIRRMGGGHKENLSNNGQILIAVINSAIKSLKENVNQLGISENSLLIIDECHKTGAKEASKIFEVERTYSLGLSATPERDNFFVDDLDKLDNQIQHFNDTLTGKELGPIIFELSYIKAIDEGILPPCEIKHYGLPLNNSEQAKYRQISQKITDLRKALQGYNKTTSNMDGGRLTGWARKAATGGGEISKIAKQYVQEIAKRKSLLYFAENRELCLLNLIKEIYDSNPNANIILFHERVEEIMRLYQVLMKQNYLVVAEHSYLPDKMRARSIDLFRNQVAKIIITGKALIEGFDAPAADVGIVIAATSSKRQTVQTIGRILRKAKDGEKLAKIYRLYMAGTTDELLYKKINFDKLIGLKKNLYYLYNPALGNEGLIKKDEPPCKPPPKESDIDISQLHKGNIYPGAYEGEEFVCDRMGNIKKRQGYGKDQSELIVTNPQDIPGEIKKIDSSAKIFKVTKQEKAVLIRKQYGKDWKTIFLGCLQTPFIFFDPSSRTESKPEVISEPVPNLSPGDEYPGPIENLKQYKIKPFRGNIVIEDPETRRYALNRQYAKDAICGLDAEKVVKQIKALKESSKATNICDINLVPSNNDIIYLQDGKHKYLCHLKNGFEFKENK